MSTKHTVAPAITGEIDLANAFNILPDAIKPWKPSIMSYSSSLFSTIVGFPLDSVKTRMQTHSFNGIFDCIKVTVKTEGIKGFFRGLTAPLLSSSITKALGVGVYTEVKPYASLLQKYSFSPIIISEDSSKHKKAITLAFNNAPVSFSAGFISGFSCSAFACPFEFTKLFQQLYLLQQAELGLSPTSMPKTTYQVAQQIIRSEGVRGLFLGFKYHSLRDSFGSAFYFSTYETAKILINGFATNDGKIDGTDILIGPISIPLAGACSGVFSWIMVFPIDTTKSLYQRDIVNNIIRGLASKPKQPVIKRSLRFPTREMYRGLNVSVIRSVFTSIAFFSAFEYLMNHVA